VALALRTALIEQELTNACRLLHGAADGWPGWYVDRFGDYVLSQGVEPLTGEQRAELGRLAAILEARGVCHKILRRQAGRGSRDCASAELILGEGPQERFAIRENGLEFEVGFEEGCSVGLFLDQRDNRRRLLTGYVGAPGFGLGGLGGGPSGTRRSEGLGQVLNVFAYTCGFSVCAARSGARTTSIDLSNRYLEWGRRNFSVNRLDPGRHEFLCGDAFGWLRRLARKPRRFDVILLDPPTFSQSRESGPFVAEKDYGRLVGAALPCLRPGGVLFASTNAALWPADRFQAAVARAIEAARRPVLERHYAPQPPDFPVTRAEPAYLKTLWLRIG
jgi:23S rRNA (cytosine1962-C5)-methyltransferase